MNQEDALMDFRCGSSTSYANKYKVTSLWSLFGMFIDIKYYENFVVVFLFSILKVLLPSVKDFLVFLLKK